jgi:hypothetical protein
MVRYSYTIHWNRTIILCMPCISLITIPSLPRSVIDSDWENNRNERVRDCYDRTTYYTHAVSSSKPPLHLPVPKPISDVAKWRDNYFYVRWNFCLYFGTKSVLCCRQYHFCMNADQRIIRRISYIFNYVLHQPNAHIYLKNIKIFYKMLDKKNPTYVSAYR